MQWNTTPALLIPLAVSLILYLWGIQKAWKSAGVGRGIPIRSCLFCLGAMLSLVIALVSPLDALSGVSFSAHMVQHLILILAAAPLLVICDYPLAMLWALPRGWSHALGGSLYHSRSLSRAWHMISNPAVAWTVFTITLWLWHASALFDLALRNESVHAVEHLAFLLSAMLFWWVLIRPYGRHSRQNSIHYGMAIPYLFTTGIQGSILGVLLTFSSQPWYPYYTTVINPWGLTPLEDQQLAGIIMWVPGGAVFTLLTIGYFAAWLQSMEKRAAERRPSE